MRKIDINLHELFGASGDSVQSNLSNLSSGLNNSGFVGFMSSLGSQLGLTGDCNYAVQCMTSALEILIKSRDYIDNACKTYSDAYVSSADEKFSNLAVISGIGFLPTIEYFRGVWFNCMWSNMSIENKYDAMCDAISTHSRLFGQKRKPKLVFMYGSDDSWAIRSTFKCGGGAITVNANSSVFKKKGTELIENLVREVFKIRTVLSPEEENLYFAAATYGKSEASEYMRRIECLQKEMIDRHIAEKLLPRIGAAKTIEETALKSAGATGTVGKAAAVETAVATSAKPLAVIGSEVPGGTPALSKGLGEQMVLGALIEGFAVGVTSKPVSEAFFGVGDLVVKGDVGAAKVSAAAWYEKACDYAFAEAEAANIRLEKSANIGDLFFNTNGVIAAQAEGFFSPFFTGLLGNAGIVGAAVVAGAKSIISYDIGILRL